MKKSKIKYFLLLIIPTIILNLIPTFALAKNEVKITADKEYLDLGDEVTLTVNISSDKEIYALNGTLNYNENIFDEVTSDNFILSGEEVLYNKDNHQFGFINKSGEVLNERRYV